MNPSRRARARRRGVTPHRRGLRNGRRACTCPCRLGAHAVGTSSAGGASPVGRRRLHGRGDRRAARRGRVRGGRRRAGATHDDRGEEREGKARMIHRRRLEQRWRQRATALFDARGRGGARSRRIPPPPARRRIAPLLPSLLAPAFNEEPHGQHADEQRSRLVPLAPCTSHDVRLPHPKDHERRELESQAAAADAVRRARRGARTRAPGTASTRSRTMSAITGVPVAFAAPAQPPGK